MNERINCIAKHCIKNTNEIGAHFFPHEKSAGHLSVSESERVVYKRVVAIGMLRGFFYIIHVILIFRSELDIRRV